jgi:transcriptional regulator with XRE-family HTH domain
MEQFTRVSDSAILSEVGKRISQARLNTNITQKYLAKEAGISHRTLTRIEVGESVQFINIIRVLRALNMLDNLNLLVPKTPESPLQKLKLKKQRQRASNQQEKLKKDSNWTWGNES